MDFSLQRALRAEGKALGSHPALYGSDPVSYYQPGYGTSKQKRGETSQRSAKRHMGAYGGLEAIDWVYDCIGLYSDAAGSAPFKLSKQDGTPLVRTKTAGTPDGHDVGPKALYDLLDAPNPYMLYDELISLLVIDLLLVGNGYWMKYKTNDVGQPIALYRLAPSHVKIIPDSFGPKEYRYQPPGAENPIRIPAAQMMHFRRPNPHDALYGMGVIQGAGRAMDLSIALTDTLAAYYENRADPSLIIESERRIPRDVFKKLAAQLRNRLSGSSRAGELLVLEAGLKASSLSANAQQGLFDVLQRMDRDRIMAKFHASPSLFGIMDETSGSNKVSDFRREFDNYTLRPFFDRLEGIVSAGLGAAYGVDFHIDHAYQAPPDDQIKIAAQIAAIPGIKIREVRRQLSAFGVEESTGDPEIDDFVLNKPGPELGPNGETIDPVTGKVTFQPPNAADRPLAGEKGRPPLAKNTSGFATAPGGSGKLGTKALLDDLDQRMALLSDRAIIEGKALKNADGSNATIGSKFQGEIPPDPHFAARDADVKSAQDFMQAALADAAMTLERGLLDHVEGKAFKPNDLVARIRKSPSWGTFKDMVEQALIEGAKRSASSAVIHQAESGRVPADALSYEDIAKSVIHRPEGLRSVIKTLKDRVAIRVARSIEKGEPLQSVIQGEVQTVIRDWSNNQASMIAETEAVHSYNEATLTVAEAMGIDKVYVTDGHDHDEPCQQADGQVWDIATARANRLEHPRCHRAFLPLEAAAV